jgi:HEAT repeat protein
MAIMNIDLPDDLHIALEADDAEPLDQLIRSGRPEIFATLRELATTFQVVNPMYRTRALYALGRLADQEVVPEIVDVLPRLDEPGRIAAIDALGRLQAAEGFDAIRSYADDPSPHVRKFVVEALARFQTPASTGTLRAMSESDPIDWVRTRAMSALSNRKHESSS